MASHGPETSSATHGPHAKLVDLGDGVRLAVVDEGQGTPILFLHGIPTSSVLWHPVIERLAPRFRCLAPDLMGFGQTDCDPARDLGLAAQKDQIVRLLDHLRIPHAIVVGHHAGGGIAQMLAAENTDRVSALVLVDAVAFDHEPAPVLRRLARVARCSPLFDLVCETGLIRRFAHSKRGLRSGAYDPASISDAFIDSCLAPLYAETPPAYRAPRERFRRALVQFVDEAPSPYLEASEALVDFENPTVIVWGCDDPFLSVSYAKRLTDEIPSCAALELIPFTGHFVPIERPEGLAALVDYVAGGGLTHIPVEAAEAVAG